MNKIILTDCDGVLLDWLSTFIDWMKARGYTVVNPDVYNVSDMFAIDKQTGQALSREFNASAAIRYLNPYCDAAWIVNRLYNDFGYRFRVITSFGLDPHAQMARKDCLHQWFGYAIEQVICLDTGADKDQALEPYRDSGMWWLEDKVKNAQVGRDLGLKPIVFAHPHNVENCGDIPLVNCWLDAARIITGDPEYLINK